MPRRWRWLVPLTALIACMVECTGAGAAPQPMTYPPLPGEEARAAREAQAVALQAIAERRARVDHEADELRGVVKRAVAQIGDGYAYGAGGPDAFDCSGLTAYAFAEVGVALPHSSYGQVAFGKPVARDEIRPGDLVFFSTAGSGASHVAIALSRTTVVSATNAGVMRHASDDAYWGGHYVTARRVL
jgi:cell wall-associated NlpC family hydrolase